MERSQSVYAINNAGVAALQAGELKAAMEAFSFALQSAANSIETSEEQVLARSWNANMNLGFEDDLHVLSAKDSYPWFKANTYTKGICLIPLSNGNSLAALLRASIVPAVIIFNLALVYHISGLKRSDEKGERLLRKSGSLYEKAKMLLREAGSSLVVSHKQPVADILVMAIYNNLAQINYHLLDYEASQSHFNDLVMFASSIRPEDHQDKAVASMLEWHRAYFLLNVFTFRAPSMAPAA